jgi:hypothetical protein
MVVPTFWFNLASFLVKPGCLGVQSTAKKVTTFLQLGAVWSDDFTAASP